MIMGAYHEGIHHRRDRICGRQSGAEAYPAWARSTVITRSAEKSRTLLPGASFVEGNPTRPGPWQEAAPKHDVIINLAGRSIFTIGPGKHGVKSSIAECR